MIYEIRDLRFAYRAGLPEVLQGVSLDLAEGQLLTILGCNGSGKSTLFGCMLGLLTPQGGEIKLCGEDLKKLSARKIATQIGYVPQSHTPTFDYTVFEFVLMGCAANVGLLSHPGAAERRQADAAIERMGLTALRDRPYTELSGGERQQVTIARAIAAQPKAILFDEPTSHLDFGNQIKVLRVIRELSADGYAVIITTHDPNHALLLGGQTALFDGRGGVEVGSPDTLLTEERLQALYGTELKLRYVDELKRSVCLYPEL